MAPKQRITKDMILKEAIAIVREHGMEALNARTLALRLNCSTQPIFSNYASMKDVSEDVVMAAEQIYQSFLQDGMQAGVYPPYKASGMYYIRFAMEERELFKLLFMRNRSMEDQKDERQSLEPLLHLLAKTFHVDMEEAYEIHVEMWLYVHGIATTIATSFLQWKEEDIERFMSYAYEGLKLRYEQKGKVK